MGSTQFPTAGGVGKSGTTSDGHLAVWDGVNTSTIKDGGAPAGGGDVTGPASSTTLAVARFNGATGKILQNSAVTIATTTGVIAGTQGVTFTGTGSGTCALAATAAAGTGVLTLPTGTDTLVGKATTDTLTNKTLTAPILTTPQIATSINDTNGNEVIKTPATASAVNEITVTNAATGTAPSITATGGDTDINLTLAGKGAGTVNIGGSGVGIAAFTEGTVAGAATGYQVLSADSTSHHLQLSSNNSSFLNIGYLEIPSNSQSAPYTTILSDSGTSIDHPASDANARTFTIDSNAHVPYAVGTCITFTNMTSQNVTIAITSDTMYLVGAGTTGSRTLAQYGVATARKILSSTWMISGINLT